jgi:hypothetical protein
MQSFKFFKMKVLFGFSGPMDLSCSRTVHTLVDVLCLRLCLALARLLILLVTDSSDIWCFGCSLFGFHTCLSMPHLLGLSSRVRF